MPGLRFRFPKSLERSDPAIGTSRNSPCTCGSGKKYKHCCLGKDRQAELAPVRGPDVAANPADLAATDRAATSGVRKPGYEGRLLRAARGERMWEVDVVPLPIALEDDPGARAAALIVMAGEYTMMCEVRARPPGEIVDLARMMAEGVKSVAARIGAFPRTLFVRHRDVAAELDEIIEAPDMNVASDPRLPALDHFSSGLLEDDQPEAGRPMITSPTLWKAWGLPSAQLAELFDATAAFHQAAPWSVFAEQEILETELPGGDCWSISVIGKEGGLPGIAVHRELDDAILCASGPTEAELARSIEDRHYFIDFSPRDDLAREMQREIASSNWTVAAPDAYPMMMSVNTPGGGITRADARALASLLRSVARLAESGDAPEVVAPNPDALALWEDPESGIRFWHPAAQIAEELGEIAAERVRNWEPPDAGHPLGSIPPELRDELQAALEPLMQGGEVPGKEELDGLVEGLVEKLNERPMEELGGLSPVRMHALLQQDWEKDEGPLVMDRTLSLDDLSGSETLWNARAFLAALVREDGTRATDAGNLSRAFVRTMLNEGRWSGIHWDYLGAEEKVINEQDFWPLHTLRVLLEMAGLIRKHKKRFVVTMRGAELVEEDSAGALYARLFRVRFREMNLAYGDRHPMGNELQQTLPFILFRLETAAKEWTDATALVPQVLLAEVRSAHPSTPFLTIDSALEHRVLDRLCAFGLAERDPVSAIVLAPERACYRLTPLFDRFLSFRTG